MPEPGTPDDRPGHPRPPRRRARHRAARPSPLAAVSGAGRLTVVAGAVALAAVVVAVVAVLVATGPGTPAPRPAAASAPARELLGWATDQLPPGVRLAADPELVEALRDAGATTALLTTASAGTPPADGTTALPVTTGALPAGSTPLARFGRGDDALQVAVADPVQPTDEQVGRRRELAEALLANPRTTAAPAVAGLLRDARVDPRLVWLLAGVTARSGVGIADLPVVAGEDDGVLRRVAVLDRFGGAPLAGDPEALAQLRSWLAAQRAPLAPDTVEPVAGGLRVAYRFSPDPDGLVARAGG